MTSHFVIHINTYIYINTYIIQSNKYVVNIQKALPKQSHTNTPDAVRKHRTEATQPKIKSLNHKTSAINPENKIVEMISTLKNSMWQELEEFGLLPMNRADYRHSWTYSFYVFISLIKWLLSIFDEMW